MFQLSSEKINGLFIVYLMLFSFFSPFVSAAENSDSTTLVGDNALVQPDPRTLTETPEETAAREAGNPLETETTIPEEPQVNEYVCDSSELQEDEVQNILDLLKEGFTIDELAGQTEKNDERDELASNELILVDPEDENVAVKSEIPNQKFKPWEISQFLNSYIDGPFAFGIVLEDSLRTGRCEEYDSPDCSLTGPNLKYRNSGAGILADTKPVRETIGDIYDSFISGDADLNQFTKEENDALRVAISKDSGLNDDGTTSETALKTATRLESELISNSMLTEFFEARLQTNCNNSACVISTYSLFDKYFNSWMSSEMVVSTFGPSLLYQTKKLFGWTGRRGFLTGVKDGYQEFLDKFRQKYITPDSFLGKARAKNVARRIDKYGWRDWYQTMVGGSADGSGYNLFKTEEFQIWWGKAQGKGGWLETVKTAEEKAELIRMLTDMRSVLRGAQARTKTAEGAYELALQSFRDPNNPVVRQKYIEYGQEISSWMDEAYDGMLGGDYIEWWIRHPNTGLYNKGVKQLRADGGSQIVDLFQEHRNAQRLTSYFRQNGTFKGIDVLDVKIGNAYETVGDNVVLYEFDKSSVTKSTGLSWSNIKSLATQGPGANIRDSFIELDNGEVMKYSAQSVPFTLKRLGANGTILEGTWKEAGQMSPTQFVDRLVQGRTGPNANMKFGVNNVEQMLDTLKERNWVDRRYWNSLDKLMAQEDELVRSYFTIKGGAKWTALPFGYWWAKKGFGVEGISQYQLPDTWHDLKFTHGSENIYDYSYIDFFANEGSDQGDLFIQVINKLPWKMILDELSDKYNPVKNLYESLTKNELRNETEDLAFYLTGPDDCVNCRMVLRTEDLTEFNPFFFVENKSLTSYILEDTKSETAKEKGQTLIAFAGHTNLVGESGREEGEPIDLAQAINEEEIKTCKEAIEDLDIYGLEFGKLLPEALTEKGRIGALLGGMESITYGAFFWAGIFSTATIQIVVAPQLHGCVDVDEGYYAHYYVPVKEEKDEQSGTTELSTEKVSNMVSDFKDTFVDSFKSDQNSITKEAVEDIGDEIDKFVKDSKSNDIVQATIRMEGLSSGQMESRELFYFWCGKGCEIRPASYKTEGKEELRGVNDVDVEIDFEKGQILKDGEPIVQSEDNVRMASTNLGIPAVEIPHTLTEACLENTAEIAITINVKGEAFVKNPQLLNCIQAGVLEQTGLPMNSEKLNDVFGQLELISTNTHPNVRPLGDKIIAEGVPRKVADKADSSITIYANKDVNLSSSNDGSTEIGKLESMQFANGTIVVKPNGCFLVWLKHHQDGILSKEDVTGLKTSIDREQNPETNCLEPAINFELFPDFDSDLKVTRVESFNEALAFQGPFTIFETPTKRYAISSEPDPTTGECKDHLRVIDKETGEVEDYTGQIVQTPEGLKLIGDDGTEHELKFSEKDGAPFVQLDGEKPELLTAAQGKNGSFYYDPDKGLWFAENAQLLPLIEAFREGIAAKVQPNGETTATASGNVLNVELGKDEGTGFLNLPSMPEDKIMLLIILSLMVASFVVIRRKRK